ncbi:hypothetical protein [Thalassobacillus hwangdonensis]|uniref:Lipoprotein n=1 Tax=Thalassobacillus hwangdonensis TaxID=546108 RepID=A0ABW3KVL9_9BACI
MKRFLGLGFICLTLFAGCSSESAANDDDKVIEPELAIEEIDEAPAQEIPSKIQVTLEDEEYNIELDEHPILENYLTTYENTKKVNDQLNFIPLDGEETTHTYLLEFGCLESGCSYLYIDLSEQTSMLLADLSKLVGQYPSPEGRYIAIKFSRGQEAETAHQVSVVDIKNDEWQKITLKTDSENLPSLTAPFLFPIASTVWKSEEELAVTVPEFNQEESFNLQDWKEKGEKTVEAIYEID